MKKALLAVLALGALASAPASAGGRVVILNAQETPFDDIADAVLSGSISEVLPRICGAG